MPLLTKMLFPAPYEVLEKKAKKKAPGTRSGLRRKGTSDVTSEDTETHSSTEDNEEEEEEEIHPPPLAGGRKKRKASTHGEAKASKKGKTSLPYNYVGATKSGGEWEPRVKPLANS